jgi:hypothetical protein
MPKVGNVIPRNYYRIHTSDHSSVDAYFICKSMHKGYLIFGLQSPITILDFLTGMSKYFGDLDSIYFIAINKTKIFESKTSRDPLPNDIEWKRLLEVFVHRERNNDGGAETNTQSEEVKMKADNTHILEDGLFTGRYYLIKTPLMSFTNAYLICPTRKRDKFVFGMFPPSMILEWLRQDPTRTEIRNPQIHPYLIAIVEKVNIYTRTEDSFNEASSVGIQDFRTMRNLLMNKLYPTRAFESIPETEFEREFEIVADDTFTPPEHINTQDTDHVDESNSSMQDTLKKLKSILDRTIENLTEMKEILNKHA